MSSCHNHGFTIAGTLVDGSGVAVANAEVRLVDSTNTGISIYSGTNGNFYTSSAWTGPAMVGARNATTTVPMVGKVTAGACNSCHANGGVTTEIHLP